MQSSQNRRVVITGIGVVTPLGNDPDQLIAALHEGQSGIKPLSRVPHDALSVNHGAEAWQFSGDIADYGPLDKQLKRAIKKGSKVMCREIEMGVAAAQLALNDSGLTEENRDPLRTGVVYGCDYIMSLPQEFIAGIAKCLDDEGQFDFSKWGQEGKPEVSPLWLLKYLPNMPASHIAIYNDLRGPNNSITLRESSAGAAMSEAFSTISRGHADVLVVGSTGSRIHLLRSVHTQLQESLAAERDEPETMSRPFNETRDGSVLGEGAGAMIFESLEHAQQRGATVLGEVMGYASSAVGPNAGDQNLKIAFENVLRGALGSEDPAKIGHIHAHGLGTVRSDAQEAAAIAEVFGEPLMQPPVTTAKGHLGNLGGGAGMVETIASLKALGGKLFPIRNLDAPAADCPINAVINAQQDAGDQFINLNITPQGQATAVRIRRV